MKKLYEFKEKLGEKELNISIKKPTRVELEEVEIFFAAILSKLMNQGVQTKAAVDKYYADNVGGAMTKDDERELIQLRKELFEKEEALIKASTDEKERQRLYNEVMDLSEKIRNYNNYYSSIYDNTAENKARNKTIDFCLLNFALLDDKPMFEGSDDDPQKRMVKQFDYLEKYQDGDDSDFWQKIIDKLTFLFTLWYMDLADNPEDFDLFLRSHYGEKKEESEVENSENEKTKDEEEVKEEPPTEG